MKQYFNIANLFSYLRILIVVFAFWHFYNFHHQTLFLFLTVFAISTDAVDGFLARKFNLVSEFGAKLDIYADRFTELAYWLFFAFLGYLSYWVFILFLIRGIFVDYFSTRIESKPLGESWIRSSPFLRSAYAVVKLLSFVLLILAPGTSYSLYLVSLALFLCYLRAYPVFYDRFLSFRD